MRIRENKQSFIKVVGGYTLMMGLYWVFKYGIAHLVDIPLRRSELTLLSYVVLYGVGMPLFLFITKTVKGHVECKKMKLLDKKPLLNIIIIQSGLSVFALSIMNIVFKVLLGSGTTVSIESSLCNFLVLLVVAPIMEEIFFRKILLDKLSLFGKNTSVFISAIFFAIPHVFSQGLPQLFYAFVLGYIWAVVRYNYDNLKVTIGLHIFSNIWCGILPMFLLKTMVGKVVYVIVFLLVIPIIGIKNVIDIGANEKADKI